MLPSLMTPVFCCDIQMAGSEFEALIQSCINTSGWLWWCNGGEDIYLAHSGPLSSHQTCKKINYNLQINLVMDRYLPMLV